MSSKNSIDISEKNFKFSLQNKRLFESRLQIMKSKEPKDPQKSIYSGIDIQKLSFISINTKPNYKKISACRSKNNSTIENSFLFSNNASINTIQIKKNKKSSNFGNSESITSRNRNSPFVVSQSSQKKTIANEGIFHYKKIGAITLKLNRPKKNDYLTESSSLNKNYEKNKTVTNGKKLTRNEPSRILKRKKESKFFWENNNLSFSRINKLYISTLGKGMKAKKDQKKRVNHNSNLSGMYKAFEFSSGGIPNKKCIEQKIIGKTKNINHCVNDNKNKNNKIMFNQKKNLNNANKIKVKKNGFFGINSRNKLASCNFLSVCGNNNGFYNKKNGNYSFKKNNVNKGNIHDNNKIKIIPAFIKSSNSNASEAEDYISNNKKEDSYLESCEESGILSLNEVEDIICYNKMNDIDKNQDYLFHYDDYSNFIKNKKSSLQNLFFPSLIKSIRVNQKRSKKKLEN